jgi:predicted RNA-binding protein with PIN domain
LTASCETHALANELRDRMEKRIAVVTSDRDLLRASVAHSVARQSASELSRKAQAPSSEMLKPSLREGERRELLVSRERRCDAVPEVAEPSRNYPAHEAVQTIDHEKPNCVGNSGTS